MKSLLLDSGAFSEWRRGGQIAVDGYASFLTRYKSNVDYYFSLDVIPGMLGRRDYRTEKVEEAARQGYANHQKLKDAGHTPIPVFHQGDDPKWLDRYRKDDEHFLALSTDKQAHENNVATWLDQCWRSLDGCKVHGLGISDAFLCNRHPWASVDSSRWYATAANGSILVPIIAAANGITS
jgi:hypothetical protein